MNRCVVSVSRYFVPALLIACWTTATNPRATQAATLVVDVDGLATATDCNGFSGAFTTIQAAVNAAAPGDTIQICPGNYNEQVVVMKSNLTIQGSGTGVTVLRPTTVLQNTTAIFSGAPVKPIVLVDGAANVTIGSLTIDGSIADSGSALFPRCPIVGFYMGVYFRNSSGTINATHVTNMTSSTVCGLAIRAEAATVRVTTNLVDRYGDAGISCAGPNTQCLVTGNTVRGQGPVDDHTQGGIDVRNQAAAKISGNVITDHFLIGAKGVQESSVGIFLSFAQPSSEPHLLQENVFANNQVNVQRLGSAAAAK